MKKILFAVFVSVVVLSGCVSNENQALIEEFVAASNEEFASEGNVMGISLSKCEYHDNEICYNFQLDIPEDYIDEIDFEELRGSYFDALKANADSDDVYYSIFKAMSEEGCVLKYRFAIPSGKEISFEINPEDLIDWNGKSIF